MFYVYIYIFSSNPQQVYIEICYVSIYTSEGWKIFTIFQTWYHGLLFVIYFIIELHENING